MKALNTKLLLSAVGLTLLAAPAFAQERNTYVQPQAQVFAPQSQYSTSAYAPRYVPGYGNIDQSGTSGEP
jgi:hypothetical protein